MKKEDVKNLKKGDRFYIRHPKYPEMEAVYEYVPPPPGSKSWAVNCFVVWDTKGKDGNSFTSFRMNPSSLHLDDFVLITPKDYPEHFI